MTRRSAATTQGSRAAVAQDGARGVLTLPAAVPFRDPVSGAATTGGRATVTVLSDREPGRLAHTRCPVAARGAALAPWCEGPWVVPHRRGPRTTPGTAPKIKGWDHAGTMGPISRLKRGTNVGPWLWS